MPLLQVRLLGQFDVKKDGATVLISSRAAQSLFAYLLLSAGTAHRREQLAGLLWPDTTEDNARKNLRHELWRLRQAIETKNPKQRAPSRLLVDDISIGFNPDSNYWLDVKIVQAGLPPAVPADHLIEILSLYRGELLPGFYDEWVVLERERVQAIFEQKMERLLGLLVAEKRWAEVLDWGERWIALGRTPEPAFRALMVAHAAQGNVSQVALIYERCIRAMRDDLGVEPSAQTRALFERLKREQRVEIPEPRPASAAAAARPEPRVDATAPLPPPTRPRTLPVPLTSFVGREHQIQEIRQLLPSTRLLTLVGSGGIGKTRLAIELARELSGEYRDGAWWVDLVSLIDPDLVPQAVARATGVREVPNVPLTETLADVLCPREVLLVLDNCEHLVTGCAELVNALLGACASLRILATSREALGIAGETTWRVPSLSLPRPQVPPDPNDLGRYESIQLLVERARAAKTNFAITPDNGQAIVQICQRLDGIPLAIELAAARVGSLSVDQIAARLDNRFSLLTRGSRTALPRHQTLRATIDWSYDLLTAPEKILLCRVSVFSGGWTLEAAEAVGASDNLNQDQVLELLARLVDKSLVLVEEQGGAARYRMLETIRQYANERLVETKEADAVRRRHLEFFVQLAEEFEPHLFRAEQWLFLDRLELELDNLRSSVDWALENGLVMMALRTVSAIPRFWFVRAHHNEGLERLRQILGLPEARQPSLVRLKALNAYLFMLWPSGQLSEFQPLIEEALALGETFGDRPNTAAALRWLGVSNMYRGEYALARSQLEQSLKIYQELGETFYSAWGFVYLGEVELLQGESHRAQAFYEQAIPSLKETKDYPFLAIPLRRLGQLAMARGDFTRASRLIKESLTQNWTVHDYRGVGACLSAFATLSIARAQTARAAKLLGAVDAVLEFIRTPLLTIDQQQYDQNVRILREQDKETFAAAWAEGHTLTLEQAMAFALEALTED